MRAEDFILGTHRDSWLWRDTPTPCVPRQLLEVRRLDRLEEATGDVMLDSGGFTELGKHGRWTWEVPQYVDFCRQVVAGLRRVIWIAPQDWMCEPFMVAKTGLSVRKHIELTVENGLALRAAAPELPIKYVVQGWAIEDYEYCCSLYEAAGVDLAAESLVGVGSVCRRQSADEIAEVFRVLHGRGLKMHGFGVKTRGFEKYAQYLTSADSLAWSYQARRHQAPMPGCEGRGHINCANCLRWALTWYDRRVAQLDRLNGLEAA
jgi:hypothetical protein